MDGRFISYLRVSTDRQGRSGLGLEGQREAVRSYLNGGSWTLSGEFVEVESGKVNDRPQLAAALAACRLTGATLVVAKIDRLARNARFLLGVVEGCGAGGVVFCDLPSIPAGPVGRFMLTQMAAVAELEAGLISARTTTALAASKARGTILGGYRGGPKVNPSLGTKALVAQSEAFAGTLAGIVVPLRDQGLSLRAIAGELAKRNVQTPRGGAWSAHAVRMVLGRLQPPA